MEISQISKSSSTDLNRVIDTTENKVSEVNSLFTTTTDTGVSNLNIQDSISDVKELTFASSVISNSSEASCSKATEKLSSTMASSKMGTKTVNETTLPGESSLILSKSAKHTS